MFFTKDNLVETRNTGFFIWIGELNKYVLGYIDIWLDFHKDDNFELWIDPNAVLASHLRELITHNIDKPTKKEDILSKQDMFVNYAMNHACKSLDEIIINFAKEYHPSLVSKLLHVIDSNLITIQQVNKRLQIRKIQDSTFYDSSTHNFYLRELMLRQNLAAASDLIRLSILYNEGGTYIDADTLPNLFNLVFEPCFSDTNSILELFTSEMLIRRLYPELITLDNESINTLKNIIKKTNFDIFYKSIKGINDIKISEINLNLDDTCLKDALHLSLKGDKEFNNNILRSHKYSRSVRIIIKEILRRYKYINKMGFDKSKNCKIKLNNYYDRLSNYRLDGLEDIENVTLILTGPIVILEVLIGISYSLKGVDNETTESEICAMMIDDPYSLGITEQTRMTGQETKSSWLKTI